MNQKLLVAAVAGLFAAPVFAQSSNVTLYGRANLGVDNYAATGATTAAGAADASLKGRFRVFDSGSRLGVRGVEDLGNGLRAIFQIESGANIDNGSNTGQGGQANASTGFLASRDSFVGLDGGFGRLTFGRQSIYWVNGTIIQTGANYINAEVAFLNGAAAGRVSGPAARQNNVVLYTTPTFGGFNASLGWAPNRENAQGQTATTGAGADANKTNGNIYGTTLRWAGGPISVQGDYWVNKAPSATVQANALGINVTKAVGMKGLVGFTYAPGAQISAVVGQNREDDSSSFTGGDVKQMFYGVSWEHTFGNVQALAQYGKQNKVKLSGCTTPTPVACSADNTATTGFMVGARYLMSKRTALYASFNQMKNQSNATTDYSGGGITSASGALPAGADPRIVAVGMIHNF
jgi:predicted porin